MNRFVKNNLVLIIVLGLSLIVTIGLLVWTTMQYLQMWRYIAQTEELREEIAKLIKKTPAPVEGNVKPIEADHELYSRLAAQIRRKFGHPLQPALEEFIKVLQQETSEITLEKFKDEFAAVWNKSNSVAEKNADYLRFKSKFGDVPWKKAMEKFHEEAAKATADPIKSENIDELFQYAASDDIPPNLKKEQLQSALEEFIKVLQQETSEITLEKFKEEFAADWNKSESVAEKNAAYGRFKKKFGAPWEKAMNKFRVEAAKATAEPINADNIDEIFQCALGVPRKLEGKPEYLLRMVTNFRKGMLDLTEDKIQFETEEATFFSFANIESAAAAAAVTTGGSGLGGPGGGGETQNDYQVENYPMIAQHWEILSDIVKRSVEIVKRSPKLGIRSFIDFRKRSVQPEKLGSFDVFHYSITVTGTMESIRALIEQLNQAYEENRVYVVRSVFLYRQENDALLLLHPELAAEKEAAESRRMSMPEVAPRRGRRIANNAPRESSEEQRKREQEERQAQEIAEREKSLPYYSRSGYGEPVIGKSDLIRAIIDVEYVMESGGGI